MTDDAPRKNWGGPCVPPDQDDIDALRRWALDDHNCWDHPDTTRQIHRVCNGVSTLRAEVMGLKGKLKRERARAKKLASGQALPPDEEEDDLGPYCHECGNDDKRRLACIDNYANGTAWRCEVCGHNFHTKPRPREE